ADQFIRLFNAKLQEVPSARLSGRAIHVGAKPGGERCLRGFDRTLWIVTPPRELIRDKVQKGQAPCRWEVKVWIEAARLDVWFCVICQHA
ncbi:MAG: hypothetical protein J0I86_04455, partial [Mesorhizobium sp.]|nr:hypothetical protein [Mesorhizobium sp.]